MVTKQDELPPDERTGALGPEQTGIHSGTTKTKLHLCDVTLSPINSGSTIFKPQSRGKPNFQSVADYPFDAWRVKRTSTEAVVELVVKYSVPKIEPAVLSVQERKADKVINTILNRL